MSSAAASSLLHLLPAEKWHNFSMGYREFLYELFEDNLVLLEGEYVFVQYRIG